MTLINSIIRSKNLLSITINGYRSFQTSAHHAIDMKWREDRGLTKNPNAHGPLTDFPDYTFMNKSQPTPLGSNQRKRIMRQREIAQKIFTMTSEMDSAKVRHQQMLDEKKRNKENIIANKLKPKGHLLLKK